MKRFRDLAVPINESGNRSKEAKKMISYMAQGIEKLKEFEFKPENVVYRDVKGYTKNLKEVKVLKSWTKFVKNNRIEFKAECILILEDKDGERDMNLTTFAYFNFADGDYNKFV